MPLAQLDPLANISGAAAPAQSTGTNANTTPAAASNAPSWLSGTIPQVVTIGLGLLLIAAGLFSFDKVRTTIVTAGKAATAAAA